MISFVVAGTFLVFLVVRFDVDLRGTAASLRDSNKWLYLLAFASYYTSFLLRGARWRLIGTNVGIARADGSRLPSVLECALMILIGWFVNAISWLRFGDAYRSYLFAAASRSNLPQSLGIIVAERVLDVAGVFALLVLATGGLLLGERFHPSLLFLGVSLGLAGTGGAGLLVMARFGSTLSRWLPPRWREVYERFHQGALGGFGRLPAVVVLTLGGWLLEVGRLYLVIAALGLTIGFPMVLFVALAGALLTTVPLTPGGVGIVEAGTVGLLTLAVAQGDAVSIAVLDRSISYVSVVVFGAIAFGLRQAMTRRRGTPPFEHR